MHYAGTFDTLPDAHFGTFKDWTCKVTWLGLSHKVKKFVGKSAYPDLDSRIYMIVMLLQSWKLGSQDNKGALKLYVQLHSALNSERNHNTK